MVGQNQSIMAQSRDTGMGSTGNVRRLLVIALVIVILQPTLIARGGSQAALDVDGSFIA